MIEYHQALIHSNKYKALHQRIKMINLPKRQFQYGWQLSSRSESERPYTQEDFKLGKNILKLSRES